MHASAPLNIPPKPSYAIVGEAKIADHLCGIMEKAFPSSECRTVGSPTEAVAQDHYVLCGTNWFSDRDRLLDSGVDRASITTIPVPIGDPWSYWEFSKPNLDKIEFADDVRMHKSDFENYLLHEVERAFVDDHGRFQLIENSYGIYHQDVIAENSAAIKYVVSQLADEKSKQTYLKVLMSEPEHCWSHYLASTFRSVQYFDYVDFAACKTVLNGGIWMGFEIPILMSALQDDAVVHNVDPFGFDYLSPYARASVEHFGNRCREHRIALDDHVGTTTLPVLFDGQASIQLRMSEMEDLAEQEFACTTIDRFVEDEGFGTHGLIKLDLEAGEVNALSQMAKTVRDYRPQLAISVYHFLNHYWDLPMMVMDVCADYDFYFEVYSWERWEGIFYAIPKEIDVR